MFSAVQQEESQFASSDAPAIFSDVEALRAASRRLSGEHSLPKRKKPKLSNTQLAKQLRTQKRAQRVNASVVKDTYVRSPSDTLKSHTSCCLKGCTEAYEANGARTHLVTQMGRMNMQNRRDFISARIGYKENPSIEPGAHVKQFFLEPASFFQSGAPLTIQPRTSTVAVCVRAMSHLTGLSLNALYQPGVPGHYFSTTAFGGQYMRSDMVATRSEDAKRWLEFTASFYMHDPTSSFIYVPFASKKVVYGLYVQDNDEFWQERDDASGDSCESNIRDAPDTIDDCIFVSRETLTYASFCTIWKKVCADSIIIVDFGFLRTLLLFMCRSVPT